MKLNEYLQRPGSMTVAQLRSAAGVKSDAQIRADFAARYGQSVLLRPSARGIGAVLWAFPLAALLLGAALLWRAAAARRNQTQALEPEAD